MGVPGKLNEETRSRILYLYMEGVKVREIAKRFGVAPRTVRQVIQDARGERR